MTIEIACHAWALNDYPLEDMLGTIARLGFRNVDLGSGPHFDLEAAARQPQREAQRIRELLDFYQLGLTDLYVMLPYINDPDPGKRQAQLALFEQLLPFALALGTPGISVSPGMEQEDGSAHAFARCIPSLLYMVQLIEETELRLSFEPHMDSAVTRPDQVLLLVEAVPGLSITLDYAHFVFQGISQEALLPLLQYTAHVQVRQAVKGRLQTPLHQGKLDLQRLLLDLETVGYQGALSIEYMTTTGWHGMMPVNILIETVKTRDTLREIRAGLAKR